jgi:tetratricopeptide (TPR) repeat protein
MAIGSNIPDEARKETAKAHLDAALSFQQAENYDESEASFLKALEYYPDYADVHLNFGSLLHSEGRYDEAEEHYKKARELNPSDYRGYYYSAYLLTSIQGRKDEGLELFKKALAIEPDDAQLQFYYGQLLTNLGRYDDAEKELLKQIQMAGESSPTCGYLGWVLVRKEKQDLSKAGEYYEKCIKLIPKDEDPSDYLYAFYDLSYIYQELDSMDRAIEYTEKTLNFNPLLYIDLYEVEPSFEKIRGDKRFEGVLKKAYKVYNDYLKENATVMPGSKAPDFELEDIEGNKVKLSNYKGKVVVLNIWATWCGPCQREIPDISDFYGEYKDKDVAVLGVSVDEGMDRGELAEHAKSMGATYPILVGTDDISDAYISKSGSIPETYFIDKDGLVRDFIVGSTDKVSIERKVKKLLK